MDIRAYFSSNRKPGTASQSNSPAPKTKQSSKSKTKSKKIFDSDSDDSDGVLDSRKKTKVSAKTTRNKRIIDSSDESENDQQSKKSKTTSNKGENSKKRSKGLQISDSSNEETSPAPKRKLAIQGKLGSPKVISKFFKETSAAAVFGEKPVQRCNSKLSEIQEKLSTKVKVDSKTDNDAAFEATLQQLDDIGDDWVDWSALDKLEKKNEPKKQAESVDEPRSKRRKQSDSKTDLRKTSLSKNIKKDISPPKDDSGFESQSTMSSDSQNNEDADLPTTKFKSPETRVISSERQCSEVSSTIPKTNSLSPRVSLSRFKFSDVSPPKPETVSSSPEKTKSTSVSPRTSLSKLSHTDRTAQKRESTTLSAETAAPKSLSPCSSTPSHVTSVASASSDDYMLWVEKHKPQSSKKIIGQQGDKSNVRKLTDWLNNWYKNNTGSKKAAFVPSGWNKDPTGACFKAALLSGPPGVGKTTSVSLVCNELGFDVVEFNASDTRSKKLLQDEVGRLLKNTSLTPYFSQEATNGSVTKKHALVMDEVDGMAGTEDRGGIQELIQLIKTTKIPIICMCNDRNHPKIRSLVNYCFDLRFSRPRVEQIKGYMRSVCFKEKLNITSEALTDIITSANNDVRLVLNHLSMLAADKNSTELEDAKKYVKLGAWDVLRKVFSKEDHKKMSIHDKCDLFFFDYGIAPLFVQENYLSVKPVNVDNNKCKKMKLYAQAADCISLGDQVDRVIRSTSAWSLLPTQAIFASYAPGEYLEGYCAGQINFPSWLGKNSKRGRIDRLLQEIQVHTRLKLSASKESINLDYAPYLRNSIIRPLVQDGTEGVKDALDKLHEYQLLKEDLDSLQEICQWPNSTNAMSNLDSKVKAAFTRMYNKNPPMRPYSLTAPIKKGTGAGDELVAEEEEDDENERSDDEADAMIVVKKKPVKKNDSAVPSTSKAAPETNKKTNAASTSKGKPKGRKK